MEEKYMFSVIIPYYNAKDTIERALDSLTRQKKYKPEFEVIIVDDNSDEEQKCDDIIKKYQNKGFDIKLEEMDFEKTYQVIVKIEKDR